MKTINVTLLTNCLSVLLRSTILAADNGIAIKVSTPKTQYILGEPVPIRVALSNASNIKQSIPRSLAMPYGAVCYTISTDGHKYERVIRPFMELDPCPNCKTPIEPGQTRVAEELFLYDGNILFPTNGHYFVQVNVTATEFLKSGIVEFDVVQPQTASDVKGSEVFRQPSNLLKNDFSLKPFSGNNV
jgi:hypothetical protein